MDRTSKKQLKSNIIKFVIGLILLSISFVYLQNHEAEKISIKSGFNVMWQKIEIKISSLFNNNKNLLENKYNLEKYYQELIRMAEEKKCLDQQIIKDLKDNYEKVRNLSNDELEAELPKYRSPVYEYERIVLAPCTNS